MLNILKKKIHSFNYVKIQLGGSIMPIEYEIISQENDVKVTLHEFVHDQTETKDELDKTVNCSKEEVIEIFNKCNLLSWDGFDGPQPEGLYDGVTFNLRAVVNDNKTINACGSENFPKHYRELMVWLNDLLK